jgi:hypothetical protein
MRIILTTLAIAGLGFPVAGASEPPGDPVTLILDDGSREDRYGVATDFFIFNRFSPDEFPLEIHEVQVLMPPPQDPDPGDPPITFRPFLWEDEDGDPLTGATLRWEGPDRVADPPDVFLTIAVDPPVLFEGPGDILVGIAKTGGSPGELNWAGTDETSPQGRSWGCFVTAPPFIPCQATAVIPVNWLVRAFGTVAVPVELQSFTVD